MEARLKGGDGMFLGIAYTNKKWVQEWYPRESCILTASQLKWETLSEPEKYALPTDSKEVILTNADR